jgi:hypothetical protein
MLKGFPEVTHKIFCPSCPRKLLLLPHSFIEIPHHNPRFTRLISEAFHSLPENIPVTSLRFAINKSSPPLMSIRTPTKMDINVSFDE